VGSVVGLEEIAVTPRVVHMPGSTHKVCQLTGEQDREWQQPTVNQTESRFGLIGTDLGVPVEHDGRIYFLFGDSWTTHPDDRYRPRDGDSIAYTDSREPEQCLPLQFIIAPDGCYLSPSVPDIQLGAFEVPTGGFSARGRMYVFFTTDATFDGGVARMGRSVLAVTADGARTFTYCYDVSRDKFINVAPVVISNHDIPGLPQLDGQGILLWASGRYRASDPYLAYLPMTGVDDRGELRYFAGIVAGSDRPAWSAREEHAVPLFSHPCIGELSVSWNLFLGKWLMLYNCREPRGINFRTADKPWGPWSEAAVLFDPWGDGGYCHFMHTSWEFRNCDSVHDPGREREWGGEYGPYVISPYTVGTSGISTIYFVMSTWNPYNTMLMRSTLRVEGE
jgi:hypothetical protein